MEENVFYGDWDKFNNWVNWLNSGGASSVIRGYLLRLAYEARARIRKHILSQDLPWVELSPVTQDKKGHNVIFVDSGKYLKSIQIKADREPDGASSYVFLEGKYPNGMALEEVAAKLEFGTPRIPARPLWRQVEEEIPGFDEYRDFPWDEFFTGAF